MLFGRSKGYVPPEKGNATIGQGSWGLCRWVWRLVATVSVVAWMGLIFYLSSSSPADLPRQIEAFSWLGKLRDVVGHLVLYGVLGPLLLVSLWSWVTRSTYQLRWALIAVGFGVLYGVIDEYHQSFVPGRSASTFDVFIDGVGVVVGVVGVWYVVETVLVRQREHLGQD